MQGGESRITPKFEEKKQIQNNIAVAIVTVNTE